MSGNSPPAASRSCGHKVVVVDTCPVCAAYFADRRLSELHDALYDYFKQPRMPDEERRVEALRERADKLIWKIHDALRKHAGSPS